MANTLSEPLLSSCPALFLCFRVVVGPARRFEHAFAKARWK